MNRLRVKRTIIKTFATFLYLMLYVYVCGRSDFFKRRRKKTINYTFQIHCVFFLWDDMARLDTR